MSELANDRLGLPLSDDSTKPVRSRRWPVTSIVERAQRFSNYIALVAQTQPQRMSDLLGYQHLILEAHLQYEGDGWVAYDCRFRQIAATYPEGLWARRNMDLLNMAFAGRQCKPYCQHCFGSTHFSEEFSGTPDTTGALNYLSVPLALEKVEGPSTTLPFLGITLDTIKMEARLPEDKLGRSREEIAQWITRKKAKK